ncbi:histidine kinase [Pontiellaceae bacterium B12219]|nr:histidine kinase [Pontiellaceae bacterium B12219]
MTHLLKHVLLAALVPVMLIGTSLGATLFPAGIDILKQELLLDAEPLTPEEIAGSSAFKASAYNRYIYTGHNKEQVWIKWSIHLPAPLKYQAVVFMDYPLSHYQSDLKNPRLHILKNGRIVETTSQTETFDNLMLPIPAHLEPGYYELLLSFTTDLKDFPLVPLIGSETEVRSMREKELATSQLTTGFMTGMILLSLFLYIQLRAPVFLWFSCCYTFGTLRACIRHYPSDLLPGIEQSSLMIAQLLLTVGAIFHYLFMCNLLNLKAHVPRLNRPLKWLILLLLAALPWQISHAGFLSSCYSFLIFIVYTTVLLCSLIHLIRRKSIHPGWIPWGWLATILGYLLVFLASFAFEPEVIRDLYRPALLIMCIETFLFGIYSGYKVREMSQQISESRAEALHAQLNPHFVFNVMNNLSGLDSLKKIDHISAEFAEFLRYILTSRLKKTVPLREEIDALKHYTAMDAIRFDQQATVEFLIPSELHSVRIAPLLLQPLLENALKHTRAQKLKPRITVSAQQQDKNSLRLCVENNGTWKEESRTDGTLTGLSNLKERLAVSYGKKGKLQFIHTTDQVCVTLIIPMRS